MVTVTGSSSIFEFPCKAFAGKWGSCRSIDVSLHSTRNNHKSFTAQSFAVKSMCESDSSSKFEQKQVWIWTEKRETMIAAVESGWNTLLFPSHRRELAAEWSSNAVFFPYFIEEDNVFDIEHNIVASFVEISSPNQLDMLLSENNEAQNLVVNFLDWQVIPAENIVATVQGTRKTVFAVSKSFSEAQTFLEALEYGLGGVVLKTEEVESVLQLKEYLDARSRKGSFLELKKARVTNVQLTGMGDRVCVDLCSLMKPGEGLLVGSFARGLFLVHSECLASNYISSRPFRVNAGPVHAYVAVPMEKTCYLSELKSGKEVVIVDHTGKQRTALVGRVKIETRQLILVEVQSEEDDETYSILLQNAETVALVSAAPKAEKYYTQIPVTSLKVGDEVLLRVQGGARHTGIEIQEFIVEK